MSSGSRRVDPPHMVGGLRTREGSFHTAFETDLYHHGEGAVSRPSLPSRGWPRGCPSELAWHPSEHFGRVSSFLWFFVFEQTSASLMQVSVPGLNRRSIQECISTPFRQVSAPGCEQAKHSGMHSAHFRQVSSPGFKQAEHS